MKILDLFEQRLEELLSAEGKTAKAARYSALGGGKRLRPLFVIGIAEGCGAPIEHALDPACALELIHTYSLIHDDLPCMDNDDMRRGKPSLHKAYGEGQALLAGDFLLTYAFQILAESRGLSPDQKVALIRIVSSHAGLSGMIGGQEKDLSCFGKPVSQQEIEEIHAGKTAALFTAACLCGGVIARFDDLKTLSDLGHAFGMAFQMKDDLEDESDAICGRPSAVQTLGRALVEKKIASAQEKILLLLEKLPPLPSYLGDLLRP